MIATVITMISTIITIAMANVITTADLALVLAARITRDVSNAREGDFAMTQAWTMTNPGIRDASSARIVTGVVGQVH